MSEHAQRGAEGACPSQLMLDRLMGDDLSDVERARIERHASTCARCVAQLAEREGEQARFAPDPVLLARLQERGPPMPAALIDESGDAAGDAEPVRAAARWRRGYQIAGALVFAAAAVALLFLARPPKKEPIPQRVATATGAPARLTTSKGATARVVVERGAARWEVSELGQVRPYDRIQVTVRLADERFVAVYARDGAGVVARYAPMEATMVALPGGGERALPNSTILDEVLGRERLAVFVCRELQPDEALRAHVERGAPAGCEVSRIELTKEAR